MNCRSVKYKMGQTSCGAKVWLLQYTEVCRNDFNYIYVFVSLNLRLFSHQANATNLKQGRENLMCEEEPSKDIVFLFFFFSSPRSLVNLSPRAIYNTTNHCKCISFMKGLVLFLLDYDNYADVCKVLNCPIL